MANVDGYVQQAYKVQQKGECCGRGEGQGPRGSCVLCHCVALVRVLWLAASFVTRISKRKSQKVC